MSLDATLGPYYSRVDSENKELNGWYGDVFTPVVVRWDTLTEITKARLIHAHDIETGKCKKHRTGVACS